MDEWTAHSDEVPHDNLLLKVHVVDWGIRLTLGVLVLLFVVRVVRALLA